MIYTDRFHWQGTLCGHLFTDTSFEELHRFAGAIGLSREWFQGDKRVPHYDLIGDDLYQRAIDTGAIPCDRKFIIRHGLRQPPK